MRKVHKGISHESHPPKKVKPLSKGLYQKVKKKKGKINNSLQKFQRFPLHLPKPKNKRAREVTDTSTNYLLIQCFGITVDMSESR
jgi:hypothetical protein